MQRRYGYRGFYDRKHKPIVLTRKNVDGIQLQGGTMLGTSRCACLLLPFSPETVLELASPHKGAQHAGVSCILGSVA